MGEPVDHDVHRPRDLLEPLSSSVDRVDVAIVGAGVSGVRAADRLSAAGRSVRVLERRNRIGGRLRSIAPLHGAGRLDLGATWCWPGERRVRRLIDELGIETHEHHLDGDALYHAAAGDGRGASQRLDGNPIDVPSIRFTDGADGLVTALAERLPPGVIRLDETVTAIEAVTAGLVVGTASGRVEAEHVVLALPPALAVETIAVPHLPTEMRRLAASTPVWMGSMAKVVVEFETPFWRESGLAGSAISHLGPMRELHDMSGPTHAPAALFGFAPLRRPGDAPSEPQVVDQLRELFGASMPDPIRVTVVSWLDDPGTSPSTAAGLSDYRTYGDRRYLTPTLGGRLHWSSTETATESPGHIEGALAAADRVADAILHQLAGPSDPTEPNRPIRSPR